MEAGIRDGSSGIGLGFDPDNVSRFSSDDDGDRHDVPDEHVACMQLAWLS